MIRWLSGMYNEAWESFFTRVLYFFNTINTYFLVAGIASFVFVYRGDLRPVPLLAGLAVATAASRIADFYPAFLAFAVPAIAAVWYASGLSSGPVLYLLAANTVIFFTVQFLFMGIPDSIVARDPRVAFIKMFNSLPTVAPTTVSFSMSVFFSFFLSFSLYAASCADSSRSLYIAVSASGFVIAGALVTRTLLPGNHFSKFHRPDTPESPMFRRVLILNIDGARKDVFDSLDLPALGRLKDEGAYHARGLETVYRALTNPAFASIFTGTVPKVHGVRDNNLGQSIKTEGLPDIVPAIAYGSMHVKHFCKPEWETKIVSLPRHSVYGSDDIMVGWLKDDLLNRPEVRLFVSDFSEADFLAHAYGSRSRAYKDALRRIDSRIGELLGWLEDNGLMDDTGIVVCSDHGISAIDHSYLIADSERYVPFYVYGKGVRKGCVLDTPGKIMDICSTVSYMLGIPYPAASRGRVFTEAFEAVDTGMLRDEIALRFNRIKYDVEAADYDSLHPETLEGDRAWWDGVASRYAKGANPGVRVLDIGCGSGFVAGRFIESGVNIERFVCVDVSPKMLDAARAAAGGRPGFEFTGTLDGLEGPFDVVAASSLFHHAARPERVARAIDRLLAPGGVVVGSHEPNRPAFDSVLFRALASAYKTAGGGMGMSGEMVDGFNRVLGSTYPGAPPVCREEILQTVEYHSPVEQYDDGVDGSSGFVPDDFFRECFPGYETVEFGTYTTFFHRPGLNGHKTLQKTLESVYNVFFSEGNLFRFVLRKPLTGVTRGKGE